ncbi:hypothetical protein MHN83_07135 [Mycobacterium sp. CnD-18-1]|nr:hypothetical protein [Mycobacterium sp. CnD-18-1]
MHMNAEVKVRGEWKAVGRVFENSYHRSGHPTTITAYADEGDYESNAPLTAEPYGGRNYYLFSALADVRNYQGIEPMAEPRGLPADVSRFVKNRSDEMGCDGHSHSWLSLAELESCDWDAPMRDSGWVGVDSYREFKELGRPTHWSGGVMGGNVVHVSNQAMDDILTNSPNDGKSYYTLAEWTWPLREAVGDFIDKAIPSLRKLLDWDGVEDVRIVFFFDN